MRCSKLRYYRDLELASTSKKSTKMSFSRCPLHFIIVNEFQFLHIFTEKNQKKHFFCPLLLTGTEMRFLFAKTCNFQQFSYAKLCNFSQLFIAILCIFFQFFSAKTCNFFKILMQKCVICTKIFQYEPQSIRQIKRMEILSRKKAFDFKRCKAGRKNLAYERIWQAVL